MRIEYMTRYEKDKNKLCSKNSLLSETIEFTENLFKENPFNPKLRTHKIICKFIGILDKNFKIDDVKYNEIIK